MQNIKIVPVQTKGPSTPESSLQEWPLDKEKQEYMWIWYLPLVFFGVPTIFNLGSILILLFFCQFGRTQYPYSYFISLLSFGKYFCPLQEEPFPFVWVDPGSCLLLLRWALVLVWGETMSSWSENQEKVFHQGGGQILEQPPQGNDHNTVASG